MHKRERGFTFIEVLVVMGIIAVLRHSQVAAHCGTGGQVEPAFARLENRHGSALGSRQR